MEWIDVLRRIKQKDYDSLSIDCAEKINELVEGYNEGLEGIEKRWREQVSINNRLSEYCDRILKRLDKHINNDK